MQIFQKYISRWWLILGIPFAFFLVPVVEFTDDTSTVLLDENEQLLGALVSKDGQWRFQPTKEVPENIRAAITLFEDRYFNYHPGVNPVSILRAVRLNWKAGEIKSGGSTITMQVVRLARKNKPRTYCEKLIEMVLAVRLELAKSKEEIMAMYVSHAPYGGNVVGIDAASWRYFSRNASHLSWSEACLLAVLPNAPSLMHPGKNRDQLLKKRNRLLKLLYDQAIVDKATYELSLLEEIPEKPVQLPQKSRHLLQQANVDFHGRTIKSTLDGRLQSTINQLVIKQHNHLKYNAIMNLAAMVVEVKTGEIKAYVGNVPNLNRAYSPDVDIIKARRSSGSTLKPILFAAMLDEGLITPQSIIPDIPTHFKGFTPRNFNLEHEGAVPASEAIVRSLNVPSVYMLKEYGYPAFHQLLKKCGFTTLNRASDHYGLSLILGGGEVTLHDLCRVYASFAHQLAHEDQMFPDNLIYESLSEKKSANQTRLSSATVYTMMETLKQLNRPVEESGWKYFESTQPVAWKTGTSFGFRDAWAIGMTPDYVVGVWAGNADGSGRAGLTGVKSAAPLLFQIINALPVSKHWFAEPEYGYISLEVCAKSGFRSGMQCKETMNINVPEKCAFSPVCQFHQTLHLNETGRFRVNANCYSMHKMRIENRFKLPPTMEFYYRQKHPDYKITPSWLDGCQPAKENLLAFIFPGNDPYVYVPRGFGGEEGAIVFEIACRNANQKLYWHMDGAFLGTTNFKHQLALTPGLGKHSITVTDEEGNSISKNFEVKTTN